MIARLDWHGRAIEVDLSAGRSVAIPIDPHGPQASFFATRPATARPLRSGDYIGDVNRGGSCNAEVIEFVPHCHGTHTECAGHVQAARQTVQETIGQSPVLAGLISISGTPAAETGESYPVALDQDEFLITRAELQSRLRELEAAGPSAVVIRTLPNGPDKLTRDYSAAPHYPLLSSEAMQWLAAQNYGHLLLDTPSLDRAHDGGRLANHRTWWGLDATAARARPDAARRSVTELIYVPDDLDDGLYWLHLELSPLVSDATPSRPVLFPVQVAAP